MTAGFRGPMKPGCGDPPASDSQRQTGCAPSMPHSRVRPGASHTPIEGNGIPISALPLQARNTPFKGTCWGERWRPHALRMLAPAGGIASTLRAAQA